MAAVSEFYLSFFYGHVLQIFNNFLFIDDLCFFFEMEVAQAEYFQHTSELKRWVNSKLYFSQIVQNERHYFWSEYFQYL